MPCVKEGKLLLPHKRRGSYTTPKLQHNSLPFACVSKNLSLGCGRTRSVQPYFQWASYDWWSLQERYFERRKRWRRKQWVSNDSEFIQLFLGHSLLAIYLHALNFVVSLSSHCDSDVIPPIDSLSVQSLANETWFCRKEFTWTSLFEETAEPLEWWFSFIKWLIFFGYYPSF
jgi:hypothetical protein